MAIVYGKSYESTKAATGEQVYLQFRVDNIGDTKVNDCFGRLINIDTGEILFYADFWLNPGGQTDSFRWFYAPILTMPNRDWNLRIETGQDDVIEDFHDITITNVPFPSERYIKNSVEECWATNYMIAGEKIPVVGIKVYNRGTDIGYGRYEMWDMNKGEIMRYSQTGNLFRNEGLAPVNQYKIHRWLNIYDMPNEDLHIQGRAYHIDPATGEWILDTTKDFIIELGVLGKLNINSNPSDAEVYLNSKFIGKTTISNYNLHPLDNIIQLFLRDYEPYRTEFYQPNDGSTKDFNIILNPLPPPEKSYINVNSTPSDAEVYLNENYIGNTPIENY